MQAPTIGGVRERWLEAGALIVLAGLMIVSACRVIWDIDVFWHIAAGRAFLTAGGLPTSDIFSAIDPDKTWISFQWGYEVWVYLLDSWGGLQLVRFAHSALICLAFGLFWWGFRVRLRLGPWVSVFLLALVMALFADRIRVRPHVFNLLAWSILFPWLASGIWSLRRRACVIHLVVVGIWANIHAGGAFIYLIAAATLPAGALLRSWMTSDKEGKGHARAAITWYLWGLIPALISPNFVLGNVQALAMLEGTEQAIGEWYPSWHYVGIGSEPLHFLAGLFPTVLFVLWLVCVVNFFGSWRRNRSDARAMMSYFPPSQMLLVLAMVVVSHRSVRFVYMSALGLVFLWPVLREMFFRKRIRVWARPVACGVLACLLFAGSYHYNIIVQQGSLSQAVTRAFGSEPLERRRFPIAQADYLEKKGFRGALFTQANWGGYLLYRLWPDVLVTADGRGNYRRPVTEDLAMVMDRRVMADARNGALVDSIYRRYPIDAVVHQHPVWPEGHRPPSSAWLQVQTDVKGAIWLRRGTAASETFLKALQREGARGGSKP